ncbi:protein LHCP TRANSLOCATION DEFECT, partial [Trifolium medium]|nr:protein LHCP TRANSLOCATION DEFECT [Trifolium medium]
TCWFKFGKNGVDAEGAGIYGSQSRDDFDRDDVEQLPTELHLKEYPKI